MQCPGQFIGLRPASRLFRFCTVAGGGRRETRPKMKQKGYERCEMHDGAENGSRNYIDQLSYSQSLRPPEKTEKTHKTIATLKLNTEAHWRQFREMPRQRQKKHKKRARSILHISTLLKPRIFRSAATEKHALSHNAPQLRSISRENRRGCPKTQNQIRRKKKEEKTHSCPFFLE